MILLTKVISTSILEGYELHNCNFAMNSCILTNLNQDLFQARGIEPVFLDQVERYLMVLTRSQLRSNSSETNCLVYSFTYLGQIKRQDPKAKAITYCFLMFHCRYLEVARSYCTRTRDICNLFDSSSVDIFNEIKKRHL